MKKLLHGDWEDMALMAAHQEHADTCHTLQDIVPRFNERMVLSMATCPNCIMMDDELNVLPTSRYC